MAYSSASRNPRDIVKHIAYRLSTVNISESWLFGGRAVGLQVIGSYKQSQVAVKYLNVLMGAKLFDNPKGHRDSRSDHQLLQPG